MENFKWVCNLVLYQRWIFPVRFVSSNSLKWRFIAAKTEKTTGGMCWKWSGTKGKQTKKIQYSWICSGLTELPLCFQSKLTWFIRILSKSQKNPQDLVKCYVLQSMFWANFIRNSSKYLEEVSSWRHVYFLQYNLRPSAESNVTASSDVDGFKPLLRQWKTSLNQTCLKTSLL